MSEGKLEPREGFQWSRVRWGRPDEPVSHVCSYCGADTGPCPLRLFNREGWAAVFCRACQVDWWGIDVDEEDLDEEDLDAVDDDDDPEDLDP